MNAYTEAEAKTKWCPFARMMDFEEFQQGPAAAGVNRFYEEISNAERCRCIASTCMAWQWEAPKMGDPFHGLTPDQWADYPELAESHRQTEREAAANPKGYCGLAGTP